MNGDIVGWGYKLIGASFKNIDTTDDCAKLCSYDKMCCSYEWSPIEKKCNLNKGCKPKTSENFRDYNFCAMGKNGN